MCFKMHGLVRQGHIHVLRLANRKFQDYFKKVAHSSWTGVSSVECNYSGHGAIEKLLTPPSRALNVL